MAKITLPDVGSLANQLSAQSSINSNFSAIENAWENNLSRDGTSPNQMEADLDLNSNSLLNVADPVAETDGVNLRSVRPLVEEFASEIAQTLIEGTAVLEVYTATAGQTDFPLPSDPGSSINMHVFVNGEAMVPDVDFALVAGPTLEFFVGLNLNDEVMVRYVQLTPGSDNVRADLASDLEAKGSALVTFLPDGAGAVASTVMEELRVAIIRPEQYGALGDGVTDDRAAFLAALAQASAIGGGVVALGAKDYALSDTITIPSGVSLVGMGSGQYPAAAFAASANFKATPKTRLLAMAGFPAGNYLVDVAVTRGQQYTHQAVRLEGLLIDCDVVATHGLRWKGVKNSQIIDVGVYRPTTAATSLGVLFDTAQGAATAATAAAGGASTITFQTSLASPRDDRFNGATITTTGGTGAGQVRTVTDYVGATKVATVDSPWGVVPDGTTVFSITGECLEGNGATQFNVIDGLWVWLGSTGGACGIEWNGDGVHDVNQNSYRNIRVVHADGPGLRMYNGDTDWLDSIATYAFGNGWGLELHGSEVTSYEGWCRDQFFSKVLFGGASVGANSGTAQAGAASTITLEVGASATNDYYKNKFVTTTGGTGPGQRRKITAYDGTTKVATVDSVWTTNPDATTTYTVNGGGGVALFKGAYRTSRFHTFDGYESGTNGAGEIYAEDGGAYTKTSETLYDLADTDGFEINLLAANAFATGTSSRLNYRRRVLGQLQEMASVREITSGTEASSNGQLAFFTRKAGATPTEAFRIGDGFQVNSGSLVKKILQASAALDFPSVAAQNFQTLTITVTGAATNDIVCLGLPSNGYAGGLAFKAHVSAADTVTVTAQNFTAAAIDPGNLSCRVMVVGF